MSAPSGTGRRTRNRRPRPSAFQREGTKEKLLRSAEKLFSQRGFRAVSVRQIAAEAGVNSALVGYHFKGKDQLFAEVFRTYGERINAQRRAALARIAARSTAPDVAGLVAAYVDPVFSLRDEDNGSIVFLQLSAVLAAERMDLYERITTDVFSRINDEFVDQLRRCLPGISRENLTWRLFAVIGAILFVTIRPYPPAMAAMRGIPEATRSGQDIMKRLLPFFVAGMSAPISDGPDPSKPKR